MNKISIAFLKEKADAECRELAGHYYRRARRAEKERNRLRAEVEALRKDAERYRWLRRGGNDDIGVVKGFDGIDCGSSSVAYTYEEGLCGEHMDAAIDAAMAAKEGE